MPLFTQDGDVTKPPRPVVPGNDLKPLDRTDYVVVGHKGPHSLSSGLLINTDQGLIELPADPDKEKR